MKIANDKESSSASEYNYTQKSVEEPKNYVQVAMAQVLWKSWKQPIYYDYEKPMTIDTLHMLIKKLYSVDYHVVAVVSDMGPGK